MPNELKICSEAPSITARASTVFADVENSIEESAVRVGEELVVYPKDAEPD